MNPSPFRRLAGSSKFIVLIGSLAAIAAGVAYGRITDERALTFAQWLISSWMAAVAAEDAAAKLAARPTQTVTAVASTSSQDAPTSSSTSPSSSTSADAP